MKKLITNLMMIALLVTVFGHILANTKFENVFAELVSTPIVGVANTDVQEDEIGDVQLVVDAVIEAESVETELVKIEAVRFSDEISIEYRGFVDDGEHMSHYMFAPSIESDYDIPLIVWLHGGGECCISPSAYEKRGIMPTLLNWELSGVNAYIICPQLTGRYGGGLWNTDVSTENVKNLIDYMVEAYNIDVNRIYLVGHSLGGQGTLYMASKLPGYFAACASLSPYYSGIADYTYDSELIVIAGSTAYGEDSTSVYFAKYYAQIIGEENAYYANSNHGNLPGIVFTADDDTDGNADIIEWFFQHERSDVELNVVEG